MEDWIDERRTCLAGEARRGKREAGACDLLVCLFAVSRSLCGVGCMYEPTIFSIPSDMMMNVMMMMMAVRSDNIHSLNRAFVVYFPRGK